MAFWSRWFNRRPRSTGFPPDEPPTEITITRLKHWAELADTSRQWLKLNRQELESAYRDRWVAIDQDRVLLQDRHLKRLCERLWTEFPDKAPGVIVEYLGRGPAFPVIPVTFWLRLLGRLRRTKPLKRRGFPPGHPFHAYPDPEHLTDEQTKLLQQWFTFADESRRWLEAHREALTRQYRSRWVVIARDQVLCHDRNVKRLCDRLWREFPDQAPWAQLEYLEPGPKPSLILSLA